MSRAPRDLTPDDRRLWARVTGSVTPAKARKAPRMTPGALPPDADGAPFPSRTAAFGDLPPRPPAFAPARPLPPVAPPGPRSTARAGPEELEPRRQRRLSRERDPIEARIDLHGFGRFEAEDRLKAFLSGCQSRGLRAVLVITGQGRMGGGVIRGAIHEWLQSAALRSVVSGFAVAHRRHGGDGAVYVTLKRRGG